MPGSEVLRACGLPDESWVNFCNGYVQAIFDSYHRASEFICTPDGTTRAALAQAVYLGLLRSPEMLDLPGAQAAAQVMAAAYPCR
jgi:hypothetical protein